jgi:hypothetical protein
MRNSWSRRLHRLDPGIDEVIVRGTGSWVSGSDGQGCVFFEVWKEVGFRILEARSNVEVYYRFNRNKTLILFKALVPFKMSVTILKIEMGNKKPHLTDSLPSRKEMALIRR